LLRVSKRRIIQEENLALSNVVSTNVELECETGTSRNTSNCTIGFTTAGWTSSLSWCTSSVWAVQCIDVKTLFLDSSRRRESQIAMSTHKGDTGQEEENR